MRVKMIGSVDLHLSSSSLWAVATICLLANLASSSDPCPPESELLPCRCTDFPLYLRSSTETLWTDATVSTTGNDNWQSTTGDDNWQTTRRDDNRQTTTGDDNWQSTTGDDNRQTATGDDNWQSTTTRGPTSTTASSKKKEKKEEEKKKKEKRQLDTYFTRERTSYYTVVTCKNVSNTHDLEEAVWNGLRKRWIDKLTLVKILPANGDALVRFPNALLRNTRVKEIEIRDTQLSGDFIHYGNPLEGQNQSMMWFTATNCSLSGQLSYSDVGTVNTMGLNKLLRLEGVDFSRNRMEYVRDIAFRYPPANLTTLDLSHNSIRVLGYRSFQYLTKLKSINLSHNFLESMRRTMFASPASYLQYIDLSWNRLTTVPDDFFANMLALETVNLSSNYMYSLQEKPWASVWRQLQFIDVTGNYFSCDCSLMWLTKILSNSEANSTSTLSPEPYSNQTVLGSCSIFERDSYPHHHDLATLTRSSLKC